MRHILCGLGILCVVATAFPEDAAAEQASDPTSLAAGGLDVGAFHSCALLIDRSVRCWGFNVDGQLGYGDTNTIGDDETPGSVGPVNFGAGRRAQAIAAGDAHTCALLDDATVRCWGFGGNGRLGYGNTNNISDPSLAGPVDLGQDRTAKAITAGAAHTCAVLDDGSVRCWGYGGEPFPRDGRLGYGNTNNIGDNETPGSVGTVKLSGGAVAISAGGAHTCALLVDHTVTCWGRNDFGQLGYGNTNYVGDTATTTPDTVGAVNLGFGHTAKAISAGGTHTCAVLDDGSVRCWGDGASGRLGYGNENTIGDNETPDSVASVNLGSERTAKAISVGDAHTCALLDDGNVRCWGLGASGRLGYGNEHHIGDNETPGSLGPVDLGPGRTAVAITAGKYHTCARLDAADVRCWGYGASGRLGYCNQESIGDNEMPGSVGPVDIGGGGAGCASSGGGSPNGGGAPPSGGGMNTTPGNGGAQVGGGSDQPAIPSEKSRARGLRTCLAGVERRARLERKRARSRSARARVERTRSRARSACLERYGRTPGRVTRLRGRATSKTKVALSFRAPGTDGRRPPAARAYLVKQSPRPIRGARDFARAQTLCKGRCRFAVTRVGTKINLTVTDLLPGTTYYYAVTARDNVSGRLGPRSKTVKAATP